MDQPTTSLLACPSCSQEMQVDDSGCLPLHSALSTQDSALSTCVGSYGPCQPSRSGPMIRPPYTPAQIDAGSAREMLEVRECANCGQPKRRGYAFCKSCFRHLPFGEIGVFLYLPVGEGFERAMIAALKWFQQQRAEAESNLFSAVA